VSEKAWIWNPKVKGSGIIECIPQKGRCPVGCPDCFFQGGRSYLAPLEENLPHIPSAEMAEGRVVRMNDGNDSNVERKLVESTAAHFKDVFFNTSIPKDLDTFPGPVVLTLNPGNMTDVDFHKLDPTPTNLMFVRVRVNAWNLESVVDKAVRWYAEKAEVTVVLTFMAYYQEKLPDEYVQCYEWKKRTMNSYWCLKQEEINKIENRYKHMGLVYTCGRKGQYSCKSCGNCLREYYATKERLRADK